jgi:hypothetical protein
MPTVIDNETGLPLEAAEKVKRRFQEYEAEIQRLKDENNVLRARVSELEAVVRKTETGVVVADVVEVRDVSDSELDVELPRPKKYRRDENSPEELGFVAEEMPESVRRVGGYDLKAVVAILAYKVSRLEKMLRQR